MAQLGSSQAACSSQRGSVSGLVGLGSARLGMGVGAAQVICKQSSHRMMDNLDFFPPAKVLWWFSFCHFVCFCFTFALGVACGLV